jgi:hypothetical protein
MVVGLLLLDEVVDVDDYLDSSSYGHRGEDPRAPFADCELGSPPGRNRRILATAPQ